MANILSVHPITGDERHSDAAPSSAFTKTYQVITDLTLPRATTSDIYAAVGVPLLFAANAELSGAEAASIRVEQSKQEDEPNNFYVYVDYGTDSFGRREPAGQNRAGQTLESQRSENPLAREALVKIRFDYMQFSSEFALPDQLANPPEQTGKLIVNTAGDPFDPAPTRNEQIMVVTVSRNYATIDVAQLADFNDSTNLYSYSFGSLGTFAPEEVWLTFEEFERRRENGIEFWPVTGVFKCRRIFDVPLATNPQRIVKHGGWNPLRMSAGFRTRFIPGQPTLKNITTHGAPVSKPQPLNDIGFEIAAVNPPALPEPPAFLRFVEKKQRDFNELNFFG